MRRLSQVLFCCVCGAFDPLKPIERDLSDAVEAIFEANEMVRPTFGMGRTSPGAMAVQPNAARQRISPG
jgi:hypothetical protein